MLRRVAVTDPYQHNVARAKISEQPTFHELRDKRPREEAEKEARKRARIAKRIAPKILKHAVDNYNDGMGMDCVVKTRLKALTEDRHGSAICNGEPMISHEYPRAVQAINSALGDDAEYRVVRAHHYETSFDMGLRFYVEPVNPLTEALPMIQPI